MVCHERPLEFEIWFVGGVRGEEVDETIIKCSESH